MISRSKWRPLKRSSMLNMLGQLHRRANLRRVCPASAICTRALNGIPIEGCAAGGALGDGQAV
jgi:hypothetical protein